MNDVFSIVMQELLASGVFDKGVREKFERNPDKVPHPALLAAEVNVLANVSAAC